MNTKSTTTNHSESTVRPRRLLLNAARILPLMLAVVSVAGFDSASADGPDRAPHPASLRGSCGKSGGKWSGWGANTGHCTRPNGDVFYFKGGDLWKACFIGVTGEVVCVRL